MSNLSVWYKRKNESKYHDVTDYIQRNTSFLSWDRNINNKLFDFDIAFYNPLDSDSLPIISDVGDTIAITENYNSLPNKIFGNSFVGIVEIIDEVYDLGVDETQNNFNTFYKLKVRNKTFSQNNINLNTIVSTNLSTLLDTILTNCNELGGNKSNGDSIPKYYIGSLEPQIHPVNVSGGELEVINSILTDIGYYFRFNYIVEQNTTNNINIIKQIEIYDVSSPSMSLSNDWVSGLSIESLRDGIIDNLDYGFNDTSQYIYTEREVSYRKDATVVKNYLKLQVAIKDLTDGALTRYLEKGSDKNIYNIGYAFDVKYVGIQVLDTILNTVSTTVFDLNTSQASTVSYYQTRLNNNSLGGKMVCRITSNSVSYFREFSISGVTVTLTNAIATLVNGNSFELVNCFDILKENELSYPGDGNGYCIKSVNKDPSSIKFTDYDSPTPAQNFICYYHPISRNYIPNQYDANIQTLGLRIFDEKIDFPITTEQKDQLINTYLKFVDPLETLSFSTYRKNLLEIGNGLNVNFGRLNKTMIVTESKGEVISDEGFYTNKPLILQKIVVSSYRDTLNDLLAKLLNISKVDESNSLVTNTEIIINESFIISEITTTTSEATTPTALPPDNITPTSFDAHWVMTNNAQYHVQVASDSSFSTIVYSNLVFYSAGIGATATITINTSTSSNLYFRVRSYNGTNYSNWSNTELISNNDLQSDSNTLTFLKFQNNYLDETANQNNAIPINSPTFGTGIIDGDAYSLQLDGVNDILNLPNTVSSSSDITVRMVFKFDSFTRPLNLLFNEWYGQSASYNYSAKLEPFYDKTNNRFLIYLHNASYGQTNFTDYIGLQSSTISLDTINPNIVHISWNNTTKVFLLAVNGTEYTMTKVEGGLTLSTLNLNPSINPHPIYFGGYTYPDNTINTPNSPNLKLARLAVDNIFRDLAFALQDAQNLGLA